MVLDEWSFQVELQTDVSSADAEKVRAVVNALLDSFCETLEDDVRAATGISNVTVGRFQ